MEGQLADFRILAVVNNATISMEVHLCLFFLCFIDFYWRIVALQCCQFLLYSKVNQPYVYRFPLFFGFPSQLSHHKALSRAPCPVQWV